jgi:hypothetical protein
LFFSNRSLSFHARCQAADHDRIKTGRVSARVPLSTGISPCSVLLHHALRLTKKEAEDFDYLEPPYQNWITQCSNTVEFFPMQGIWRTLLSEFERYGKANFLLP